MDPIAIERYSTALFGASEDSGEVSNVLEDLESLKLSFKSSGLENYLCNPQHSLVKKNIVLTQIGDKFLSKLTANFLKLLLKKSRIAILSGVIRRFKELEKRSRGIVVCNMKLREEPTLEFINKIKLALKRITRNDVELNVSIDSKMIGGTVVRIGNRVIDASIGSRIKDLKKKLLATKIY